jgi:O-antigen/teichoic acid export membrane protein
MTVKCVRHTLAMVSAACLLLFIFGPMLINHIYGQAFAGAGAALRFLLPGIIAYSMVPFFNAFFTQQLGKVNVPLVISSVSAFLCAVITFATVRHWGIVGGAFATSVTYVGALVANALLFTKETRVPIKSLVTFRQEDVRPYATLLASIWNRASAFAGGKRS